MKRFVLMLSLAAVAAVGLTVFTAPPAQAADRLAAQLVSTDGGPTNLLTALTNSTYAVQCKIPSCLRVYTVDDGGPGACPGQDPILPGTITDQTNVAPSQPPLLYTFDTATADLKVRARARDAGDPGCNVWLRTSNKPRTVP
jgi:hypothetical protein